MCFPRSFPKSPGRPTADDLKAARVLTKSTASASPARADQWCVAALAGLVALLAFAYSFFMNRAIYPDELGFYNPIYIRHKYEGMRATLMGECKSREKVWGSIIEMPVGSLLARLRKEDRPMRVYRTFTDAVETAKGIVVTPDAWPFDLDRRR